MFDDIKRNHMNIFELGLGSNNPNFDSNTGQYGKPGASLFGWREYFSNSKIYGGDIDDQILFESNNIKTYHCDQKSARSIDRMFTTYFKNTQFDIIKDDATHEYCATYNFLVNSIKYLKKEGYYIVEDVCRFNYNVFLGELDNLKYMYNLTDMQLFTIPYEYNQDDNCLLIINK